MRIIIKNLADKAVINVGAFELVGEDTNNPQILRPAMESLISIF